MTDTDHWFVVEFLSYLLMHNIYFTNKNCNKIFYSHPILTCVVESEWRWLIFNTLNKEMGLLTTRGALAGTGHTLQASHHMGWLPTTTTDCPSHGLTAHHVSWLPVNQSALCPSQVLCYGFINSPLTQLSPFSINFIWWAGPLLSGVPLSALHNSCCSIQNLP